MRYHIVDIKGTVYGDFGKKAKAQAALDGSRAQRDGIPWMGEAGSLR